MSCSRGATGMVSRGSLSRWGLGVWFTLCLLLTSLAVSLRADPVAEGVALAQELLGQRPDAATTNAGTLRIRARGQPATTLPLRVLMLPNHPDWQGRYEAGEGTNQVSLIIQHGAGTNRGYTLIESGPDGPRITHPAGNATMVPFAGSDFWIADLGLEFLHWPQQRIVAREMRRSRACLVLESTNPNPAPGAYRRVRAWIDTENRGMVIAEAYDDSNRLLKTFTPTSIVKVQGAYTLEEMELRNLQTRSQSLIKFDLTPPKR